MVLITGISSTSVAQLRPADAAHLMNWIEYKNTGNKEFKFTFVTSLFNGYEFPPDQTFVLYFKSGNLYDSVILTKEKSEKLDYKCTTNPQPCNDETCLEWEQVFFSSVVNFNTFSSGAFNSSTVCNVDLIISPKKTEFQRFFGSPKGGGYSYYPLGKEIFIRSNINLCYTWNTGDISPIFIKPPNHLEFRVGQLNAYSMAAKHNAGDSMDYEIVCPLTDGQNCLEYKNYYRDDFPFELYCQNGTPCLSRYHPTRPRGMGMNRETGELYFIPQTGGQSRIAVKATMFRRDANNNWVKTGYTTWESFVQLTHFTKNYLPTITSPDFYVGCEGTPVIFEQRPRADDELTLNNSPYKHPILTWQTEITNANIRALQFFPEGTLLDVQWIPQFGQARSNPYHINIFADDNDCLLPGRAAKTIRIKVLESPEIKLSFDTSKCGHLIFSAENLKETGVTYDWKWYKKGDSTVYFSSTLERDSFLVYGYDTFELNFRVINKDNKCERNYKQFIPFSGTPALQVYLPNSPDTLLCKNNFTELKTTLLFPRGAVNYTWKQDNTNLNHSSDTYSFDPVKDSSRFAVYVSDSKGCFSGDTLSYRLKSAPKIGLGPDITVCPGEEISLRAYPEFYSSILWLPDSSSEKEFKTRDTGLFIAKAFFSNNCYSTDTIKLNMVPFSNIIVDTLVGLCPGFNYTTTAKWLSQSTNISGNWTWKENQSIVSNDTFLSINPDSSGTLIYNLTWKFGNKNCSVKDSVEIEIYPAAIANFELSDTSLCFRGNTFETTNLDTSTNSNYEWKLSDNQIFNQKDITFSSTQSGQISVKLKTNTNKNCKDSAVKLIQIHPNPEAKIGTAQTAICLNKGPLTIVGQGTIGSGNIKELIFSGDDFPQETLFQNFTRNYNPIDTGRRIIQLIAISDQGCADTSLSSYAIYPLPNYTIAAKGICANEEVSLEIINTDNLPFDWNLDFLNSQTSGGNLSPGQTGSISSPGPGKEGSYPLFVTATNQYGCEVRDSISVNLLPAPEISIDWWKDITSGGLDFGFSGMGDRIRNWNWEIINTHSHIGKQFNYTFADTGIYTVVLTAEGNNGCKNTDTAQVPVFYKIVLFIPDAFSPNNDGTNDVFKPEGIFFYLDYKLEIFNGWGAKMFETKNPNEGWNGKNATQDVYVYLISILNTYGEKEVFKGTFHLIR